MDTEIEIDEKDRAQKPWTIEDESYRFAPKREGDPWQRLLDSVLQKENIRCDAWKDEVGNLLIFAGLFSAVVTAFIIESYKTLQPDPNLDVVTLLSQISSQLSNPGNDTLQTRLPSASFSAGSSAIRVNVFWFLSLILSLTTVLVGIVALQWLREYQAYPGQSARNAFAIHHMRAEGMDKWHVWDILAALPLLLQIALVLFFAGVIDFLDALGSHAVAISVTTVIAITLFFLIVTTTLPAIQIVYLRIILIFSFQPNKPPSQCPYKSPQANLFRIASDAFPRLIASLLGYSSIPLQYAFHPVLQHDRYRRITRSLKRPFARLSDNSKLPIRYHLLSFRFLNKHWIDFDLIWLQVRDAYSRHKYMAAGADIQGDEIEDFTSQIIPVFDVMTAVRDFNLFPDDVDRSFDVYHCYSDLSKLLTVSRINDYGYRAVDVHILWKRNQHFRSFIPVTDLPVPDDGLINRLKPDVADWEGGHTDDIVPTSAAIKILHELNMNRFLNFRTYTGLRPLQALHHEEVRFRIQNYMFGRKTNVGGDLHFPSFLQFGYLGSYQSRWTRAVIRRQSILVYHQFFRYLSRRDTVVAPEDLHAQSTNWNNLNLLGATLSQEIIESTRPADHQSIYPQTVEDFLLHLTSSLNETLSEAQPRQNVIYAILYASLPLRSIDSTLQERGDTQSDIYKLYKKLLSIIHEYMKRPIDMYDSELDVSIDTVLERTGDPFDVLAFITQASWKGSRNGVAVPDINPRRLRGSVKHKNEEVLLGTTWRQTDITDITYAEGQTSISNVFELTTPRDIERGVRSSTIP